MQNDDLAVAGLAEAEVDRSHDSKLTSEKAYTAHEGAVTKQQSVDDYSASDEFEEELHHDSPTAEERATLPRVSDRLELTAYMM